MKTENPKLSALVFYFSILIFIIGFNFSDTMVGNWYQQFMPNIGGRQVQDITFLDSLNGYASARQTGDTSYILKTINGGDNWSIIYRNFFAMTQIQFLNVNTGYAVGAYLFKTIDGGFNWSQVTAPAISPEELFVLNEDTIWIISSNSLTGGVFRTTNGGVSWTQQFSGGNQNPNKIYMYNARIGFHSNNSGTPNIYKTTNGGVNWVINLPGEYFNDMHFADSLTGWKCMTGIIAGDSSFKKTTNGGVSWTKQVLPSGGIIIAPVIGDFYNFGTDTIWGVGSGAFYGGGQFRGILFRTTNGGTNWLFQVPDTAIHISSYKYIRFTDSRKAWAYSISSTQGGVHTTTGGDPVWLTDVKQISSEVPVEYSLKQNYPNPFNPVTIIQYSIKSSVFVKLAIYDITGKEIKLVTNGFQTPGVYQYIFDGDNFSSGVYFYSLELDDKIIDTKKMILIK